MSEISTEYGRDGDAALARKVDRPSGIAQFTDELVGATERLHLTIGDLESRASAVLRVAEDARGTVGADPRAALSPHANHLGQLVDQVEAANWRIAEIIGRLDL